jgi:hypothetical protein
MPPNVPIIEVKKLTSHKKGGPRLDEVIVRVEATEDSPPS